MTTLQVFPVSALDDQMNRLESDGELGRQGALRDAAFGMPSPDLDNLLSREFRVGHLLAASHYFGMTSPEVPVSGYGTALARSVRIVGLGIPEEEVFRSDAQSVIAVMADKQTVGNGAIVHFPRDARGRDDSVCSIRRRTDAQLSIASRATASRPEPAAFRLLHLFPEALGNGSWNEALAGVRRGCEVVDHRRILPAAA